MLLGYLVSAYSSKNSTGFGQGTIAQIRARRREEIEQEQIRAAREFISDPPEMKAIFDKLMKD